MGGGTAHMPWLLGPRSIDSAGTNGEGEPVVGGASYIFPLAQPINGARRERADAAIGLGAADGTVHSTSTGEMLLAHLPDNGSLDSRSTASILAPPRVRWRKVRVALR